MLLPGVAMAVVLLLLLKKLGKLIRETRIELDFFRNLIDAVYDNTEEQPL